MPGRQNEQQRDCFEMLGAGCGLHREGVGHTQCLGVIDFWCNFNIISSKSSISNIECYNLIDYIIEYCKYYSVRMGLRHSLKICWLVSDWFSGTNYWLGGEKTSLASVQIVEGSNLCTKL